MVCENGWESEVLENLKESLSGSRKLVGVPKWFMKTCWGPYWFMKTCGSTLVIQVKGVGASKWFLKTC